MKDVDKKGFGTATTAIVVVIAICAISVGVWMSLQSRASDARRVSASLKMKNMMRAIHSYTASHGADDGFNYEFPASLTDIPGIHEIMGPDLYNSYTRSSPGFEYVNPGLSDGSYYTIAPDGTQTKSNETPVIYQLRDGDRVLDAPIAYADGSVR